MAKRPSYKRLMLEARGDYLNAKCEAEELRHELERVRAVLAAEGEGILKALLQRQRASARPPVEPHEMRPLDFECATSYIRSNSRVAVDETITGYTAWWFRGQPLVCKA